MCANGPGDRALRGRQRLISLIDVCQDCAMRQRARILVVDDDARVAAALRRAHVYERYEVDVAEHGRRALDFARERIPDLSS